MGGETAPPAPSGPALETAVIPTGAANIASVLAGLRRAGAAPQVTLDLVRIAEAPLAVLPGVGSFAHARRALDEAGLASVVQARIAAGRPLLAVCVGMQLLFDASEESPGVPGLGVLPGTVGRFAGAGVRVPQMGWNRVEVHPARTARGGAADDPLARTGGGTAAFAHSYRVPADALALLPGTLATAEHGGERFVAAFARGGLLACQCHPELSGGWGRRLLSACVAMARTASRTTSERTTC